MATWLTSLNWFLTAAPKHPTGQWNHSPVSTWAPLLILFPLPRMPFPTSLPGELWLIFQDQLPLGSLPQRPPQKEAVTHFSTLSQYLFISWYLAHYLLIFIYLSLLLLVKSSKIGMECDSMFRQPWIPMPTIAPIPGTQKSVLTCTERVTENCPNLWRTQELLIQAIHRLHAGKSCWKWRNTLLKVCKLMKFFRVQYRDIVQHFKRVNSLTWPSHF